MIDDLIKKDDLNTSLDDFLLNDDDDLINF